MLNRSWLLLGLTLSSGIACTNGIGGQPESTEAVTSPDTTDVALRKNGFSPRYHYVSLNSVPLPAGYSFFDPSIGIDDYGRILGNLYDSNFTPHVAEYTQGHVVRLLQQQPSLAGVVNRVGTVGGGLVTDVVNVYQQAALFSGDHEISSPSSEMGNGYLVPTPGTRLNLADLVDDVPPTSSGPFYLITGLNDIGEMIGLSLNGDSYLLEPMDRR